MNWRFSTSVRGCRPSQGGVGSFRFPHIDLSRGSSIFEQGSRDLIELASSHGTPTAEGHRDGLFVRPPRASARRPRRRDGDRRRRQQVSRQPLLGPPTEPARRERDRVPPGPSGTGPGRPGPSMPTGSPRPSNRGLTARSRSTASGSGWGERRGTVGASRRWVDGKKNLKAAEQDHPDPARLPAAVARRDTRVGPRPLGLRGRDLGEHEHDQSSRPQPRRGAAGDADATRPPEDDHVRRRAEGHRPGGVSGRRGAIKGGPLEAYLHQQPAEALRSGDGVVMDNLACHERAGVCQAIEVA